PNAPRRDSPPWRSDPAAPAWQVRPARASRLRRRRDRGRAGRPGRSLMRPAAIMAGAVIIAGAAANARAQQQHTTLTVTGGASSVFPVPSPSAFGNYAYNP